MYFMTHYAMGKRNFRTLGSPRYLVKMIAYCVLFMSWETALVKVSTISTIDETRQKYC